MTAITSRHVARKRHICGSGCVIEPGQPYLRWVATPHDNDLGNERWWHMRECADCATRYGRVSLLEPTQPEATA